MNDLVVYDEELFESDDKYVRTMFGENKIFITKLFDRIDEACEDILD